jgi:hypothetical protein
MIISNSRKYIFFHVPKSGGTSIAKLLDLGLSWNDVIIGGTGIGEVFNGDWARRFRVFKHTTPADLRQILGDQVFGNYYKFMFVRDPITRFKSASQFLYQVVKEERDWVLRSYSEDHLSEIRALQTVGDVIKSSFFSSICEKSQGSCNEPEMWFKPQSIYYELLGAEYANSSSFYKLENLEESIRDIAARGVFTESELNASSIFKVKSNQSKKLISDELSNDDIKHLKILYSSDYKLLGYN